MDDAATRDTNGIARGCSGGNTGDGTALKVTLGFRPQHVKVANLTDVVTWEKFDTMGATQTLKTVTAGTLTVDTTSAITIQDDGFTVSAAANADAKVLAWVAL